MKVTCTTYQLSQARDVGSAFVELTGTDEATGDLVTFRCNEAAYIQACGELETEVPFEMPESAAVQRIPLRRARIARSPVGGPTGEVAARFLPANYKVTEVTPEWVFIEGHDNAGWTLDGYVIPRLASGLIWAAEVDGT